MIRRSIFAAIIAIGTFVLGFAAFAGVNHYTDASASVSAAPATKTPTAAAATPTPAPPQPLAVVEQNLDGSGNIKVHEQGTVNVNVVSSAVPRFIPIVAGATVLQGQPYTPQGGFVNVSDCAHLDLFITASVSNNTAPVGQVVPWLYASLDLSPDGTTAFGPASDLSLGQVSGLTANGTTLHVVGRTVWNTSWAASPYVRLNIGGSGEHGYSVGADPTNITAQLYCS